jgi:exosome complex RNA-binding protein Rrp4
LILIKFTHKLRNGVLVTVSPIFIRRLKSHFITLACGVDVILGLNGFIWVMKSVPENEHEGEEGFDSEGVYRNYNDVSIQRSPKFRVLKFVPHRKLIPIRELLLHGCAI